MRVLVNGPLLRRRERTSFLYLAGATVCLVGGFGLSLAQSDVGLQYAISLSSLFLGLLLWGRNQRYLQRWGPRWRQDGNLRQALRALDDRYHLLVAPRSGLPDYLLVGPMGVLVLIATPITGTVQCLRNRWYHDDGRPWVMRLVLWFSPRPSLGNPSLEGQYGVQMVRAHLAGRVAEELEARLPVQALILFTEPKVSLRVEGCQASALLLRSLRNHVRRLPQTVGQREVMGLVDHLTG